MERQEIPQGSSGGAGSINMDISELGTGAENTSGNDTIRAKTKNAEKCRKRYWSNPEKWRKRGVKWWADHHDKALARKRELHKINAEHIRKYRKPYSRNYYLKNRQKFVEYGKIYYQKNKEKVKARNTKRRPEIRAYVRHLKATNPQFRIGKACRQLVSQALKRAKVKKRETAFYLIGCSPTFFKQHIESQFNRMMNWSNYAKYWEIDHILPVTAFNLEDKEQRLKAFHYSNCRPLEVACNRAKRNKLPNGELPIHTVSPTQNCNPPTTSHKPHHSCKIPV